MHPPHEWVDDGDAVLLIDLYQLEMLEGYWAQGMDAEATFSLFVRRLPSHRSYLLACGLEQVLHYLEHLRFTDATLAWLRSRAELTEDLLERLPALRFTGDVRAVPEGSPLFAGEPILEIMAPLPQAQLVRDLGDEPAAPADGARFPAPCAT